LCGFFARQIAPDTTVDDRHAVFGNRCEVDAVREVAVSHLHACPQRFHRTAAGVIHARVVAEDREHGDVGLRRDPLADCVDGAVASARGQRIEVRVPRSFKRSLVAELRQWVVAEPIEHHVHDLVHPSRYLTISAKSSASSDAPPTSAPSMLSSAMKSLAFPGFTLPPYW